MIDKGQINTKYKILILAKEQRLLDQLNWTNEINKNNQFLIHFIVPPELTLAANLDLSKYNFNWINIKGSDNDRKIKSNSTLNITYLFKKLLNKRLVRSLKEKLAYLSFFQIISYYKIIKVLKYNYKTLHRIITEQQPDIIIVPGDRHKGIEPSLLKVCKDLKIPTIIPYLSYSGEEASRIMKSNKIYSRSYYSSLFTNYIWKKLPNQIYNGKLFYTPPMTLALRKFGTLPINPWAMGTGLSDVVCVDNLHTYNRYINNGVNKEKLEIVGDVAYDQLFLCYKDKLNKRLLIIEKYELDESKKIIIVSLPQYAEHFILDWDEHWKEIHFVMQQLNVFDQNILISLHPKMDKNKYIFLEKEYSCKILNERLYDVLPVADVFITEFSSTVIWSVLCGINTLILDLLNIKFKMFDFLNSVIILNDRSQYKDIIKQLLNEKSNFIKDWQLLSRDKIFDGRIIDRSINVLIKTIENNQY